jgi:hypothetical protein
VELFKTNTNMPALYYSIEKNGSHFIFLGGEAKGLNAELGTEQLTWLENQLKEISAKSPEGPIYLFLHQSLKNTVSGSLPGQGWDGVNQDTKLRNLLNKYPQAIMFSGHSHWELDSNQPMYDGKDSGATFFNTASVGYLWTDAQTGKEGSQGYYVEVYQDKLLVRGRDFVTGEWVTGAQFIVDLSEKIASAPEETETSENPAETTKPGDGEENNIPKTTDSNILKYIMLIAIALPCMLVFRRYSKKIFVKK